MNHVNCGVVRDERIQRGVDEGPWGDRDVCGNGTEEDCDVSQERGPTWSQERDHCVAERRKWEKGRFLHSQSEHLEGDVWGDHIDDGTSENAALAPADPLGNKAEAPKHKAADDNAVVPDSPSKRPKVTHVGLEAETPLAQHQNTGGAPPTKPAQSALWVASLSVS